MNVYIINEFDIPPCLSEKVSNERENGVRVTNLKAINEK